MLPIDAALRCAVPVPIERDVVAGCLNPSKRPRVLLGDAVAERARRTPAREQLDATPGPS